MSLTTNYLYNYQVTYDSGSQLSYYEQAKAAILARPFASIEEKTDFEYPLRLWGEYCNTKRELRRSQYIVPKYLTIEQLKTNALFSMTVSNDAHNTIAFIFTDQNINGLETAGVVISANETLLGGGGCDHLIHSGAGPLLLRECATLTGCQVGEAVMTKGYHLPANYVLHTVGPLLEVDDGPDQISLAECYKSCLNLAEEYKLESLAFPCISCNFYGFPVEVAAPVVLKTVLEYIGDNNCNLQTIVFSLYGKKEQEAYHSAVKLYTGE